MTLKITYAELEREVGRFLGFDRNPANWSSDQDQDVQDIIAGGQRHFYWPPSLGEGPAHRWSFLCPHASLSITPDTYKYSLPDDFVRVCSAFTYSEDDHNGRLVSVPDDRIRSLLSGGSRKGVPRYCSIVPRSQDDTGYELWLFPIPDQPLTLSYRYEKTPSTLGDSNQEHLGPATHSELLLSACLMVADKMLNGESIAPDGGLHAQRFFRQLAASIATDREALIAEP